MVKSKKDKQKNKKTPKSESRNHPRKNVDAIITAWMGSLPSILIHTILFTLFLMSPLFGFELEKSLLVLTTIVSLEAIYLSLFIQISINRQAATIEEVSEDIEEIQEDMEEIQEDVEDIQEDMEEVSHSVEELSEDVEEVSKEIEEIGEDIEEIQEDVEEIQEEDTEEEIAEKVAFAKEEQRKSDQKERLEKIENILEKLLKDIGDIKK